MQCNIISKPIAVNPYRKQSATIYCYYAICLMAVLLCFPSKGHSQDPVFSLFQTNPLNFNPAHVGNTDFSRLSIGYRNQNPSYNAFQSYAASFDTYLHSINSGIGIIALRDQTGNGVYKQTTIGAGYSYNTKLADGIFLRGGLEATYCLQQSNPNNLTFPDMVDINGGVIPNPSPYMTLNSKWFNVGAGLALLVKNLKVGAAAFNLNGKSQNSQNGVELPNPLRVNVYASYDIPLAKEGNGSGGLFDPANMTISPNIQYMQQYGIQQLSIGAYFDADIIFAGLNMRQDMSFKSTIFSLAAGVNIDRFTIAVSGDMAQLGNPSGGMLLSAYEVSLSIKLWENEASSGYREGKGSSHRMLKGTLQDGYDESKGKKTKRYRCPY